MGRGGGRCQELEMIPKAWLEALRGGRCEAEDSAGWVCVEKSVPRGVRQRLGWSGGGGRQGTPRWAWPGTPRGDQLLRLGGPFWKAGGIRAQAAEMQRVSHSKDSMREGLFLACFFFFFPLGVGFGSGRQGQHE